MRKFILLFMLIFTFSCVTRNIRYDRDKILKRMYSGYKILLDDKEIPFQTVFLDKQNIETVKINKENKSLIIKQLNTGELLRIQDLNLESLSSLRKDWDKINLIMLDGVLIVGRLKDDIKIAPNAIEYVELISDEKMHKLNLCGHYNGNVLLITTK